MKPATPRRKPWRLLSAVVVVLAIIGGSMSCSAAANATSGTVVRVIDGDTLVVSTNNRDQTIRLLNVDAPETKDPDKTVECLGSEASAYLKETLPPGAHITLDFDVEKHDSDGQTLAAVVNDSGQLVNAEIARAGLVIPVAGGSNAKYLATVQLAHDEAKAAGKGLFGNTVPCTLPARIETSIAALDASMAAEAAKTSGAAITAIAAAVAAVGTAKAVHAVLADVGPPAKPVVWAAFTSSDTSRHLSRLTAAIDRVNSHVPLAGEPP